MSLLVVMYIVGIYLFISGLIFFYKAKALLDETKYIKSDIDEFRGNLIKLAAQRKRRF